MGEALTCPPQVLATRHALDETEAQAPPAASAAFALLLIEYDRVFESEGLCKEGVYGERFSESSFQ